jgi:hypothetical protein
MLWLRWEDVVRVVALLQHGQRRQLVRSVGPPHPALPLVAESIHVDAAGEGLDRGPVAAGRRDPALVLRWIRPAGSCDELDLGVAVAEGGLVFGA